MGPPAGRPSILKTSRQSLSGPPNKNSINKSSSSLVGTGGSNTLRQSLSERQQVNGAERRKLSDTPASPTIDEEEDDSLTTRLNGGAHYTEPPDVEEDILSPRTVEGVETARTMSTTHSGSRGGFEGRAATQREIEQLKGKIRMLEKKRQEDRDKIKSVDVLKADKDKFETIMQALQKKLQSSQQEMSELREKYKEAESRAIQLESKEGEHESEMENALLDKEMAEERAESLNAELQALKIKHEELELETDVLREQNSELSSVMSPEEKANAGWLSLEREKDRLREALLALRDMSQQTESDLRSQVKDLERDLQEFDGVSVKYQDVSEKLAHSEATNKHLMEQLEAAESHEEVNLNLELEKDRYIQEIAELKTQLQAVQEEVNVNDELERYHIETQKELQEELDMRQILLNEREHSSNEQSKIIEDLEYTLTKFRDLVSGLQNEINELRVSRNISESEASEMNNKSRAIMDLNLKLQSSASKSQIKTIDIELDRLKAEESAQHLSIVQMFVPESFAHENNPIMALMCFKRIKSKAAIVSFVLRDRSKAAQNLLREDQLATFEVLERLTWISTCCDRFISFMSSCTVQEFARYHNAMYELEPVERAMNIWIDVLRRDELFNKGGAEELSRMIAVLSDLAEKLITAGLESKACELAARSINVENLLDITTAELTLLASLVKSHLGEAENEESLHFVKRMDQLTSKTRTMRFVSGKITKEIQSHRSDGLALTGSSCDLFLQVENAAKELTYLVRRSGEAVLSQASGTERTQPFTICEILDVITNSVKAFVSPGSAVQYDGGDGISYIGTVVQQLHANIDQMQYTAADLSNTAEFEKRPAPWIIRSKEVKERKIVPPDTEEELKKLKAQVQDQVLALNGKDRQLEECGIKIEFLESRTKDSKQYTTTIQRLEAELEGFRRAKNQADADLEKMRNDYTILVGQHEKGTAELHALRKARIVGDQVPRVGDIVTRDESAVLQLTAEIDFLRQEISSLQSAIRYMKRENQLLKMPSGSISIVHSWLDPSSLSRPRPSEKASRAAAESKGVFDALLDLAASMKPVALKERDAKGNTSRRAGKSTSRLQVIDQREELDKWFEWKDDLLKQVRVANIGPGLKKPIVQAVHPISAQKSSMDDPGTLTRELDGITIVESPP
jgi:dynactin 1